MMDTEIREGTLYIRGEVTVKTVKADNYLRFEKQCRLPEVRVLDLSGISRADSACVSLILSALRLKPGTLALNGIPDSVNALADLYEIKEWVGL